MRRFQTLLVIIFAMGVASLGGVLACAQDREDVFIPPPSEEEAKREKLPKELKGVSARWIYHDDGKIIGVSFYDTGPSLGRARVRPEDLEHLSKLAHLESVAADSELTTDDTLKALGKLTKLKELHLTMCKITSKGVAHLKPLQNLVVLDLSMTEINDEAMKVVAKFEKLEVLDVSDTDVSDFGVAELYQHKKLRKLTIGSHSGLQSGLITNDSIGALSNIKSLRLIDFSGTAILDAKALQRALPDCDLIPPGGVDLLDE